MNDPLCAEEALSRLLAAAWAPEDLPRAETIPWPEVLRLVEPSNVAGAVYAATQGLRRSLPPDIRVALEQGFYRSAAANTRYLNQLAEVGRVLSRLGAPLLVLKGAALAQTLYADPALRFIGDLDLAVPERDVPLCRRALLELGYVPGRSEHRTGSRLAHRNQELFEPAVPGQAAVELHWHILDVPYYLRHVPMDWFWDNSQTLSMEGQPFQVLNAEANLVYLPAHLALHHQYRGLHSYLDLALLIVQNRSQIDWSKVFCAAESFELLSALRETLARLARCWPSLPLEEPRRQLAALKPSRMDDRLCQLLSARSRSTTLDFYTTLVSLPDLPARARYAWCNVFPQPAYMRSRYRVDRSWQLPYWYVYRLVKGLPRLARIVPNARRLERGQP